MLYSFKNNSKQDKQLPIIEQECYHNQLKPILLMMKLFGIVSLEMTKTGFPRFRLFSLTTTYCISIWVMLAMSSCINLRHFLSHYFNKEDKVADTFITLLQMYIMICVICLHTLTMCDVLSLISYMKKWQQFQQHFMDVTGKHLCLSVRKTCISYVIFLCVCCFGTGWFHFSEPYVPLQRMMPFFFLALLTNGPKCLWHCTYMGLEAASRSMTTRFKYELRTRDEKVEVIDKYRLLWFHLTKLISETGGVTRKTFVAYHVLVIITLILTTYGCLICIRKTFSNFITMGSSTLVVIVPFYYLCNAADHLTNLVKNEVLMELNLIKLKKRSIAARQEIKTFLLTILLNPPAISVAGFTKTNRKLFKSYISALVTYLIVLLQFEIGQV